jgi:hypothetical protein
MWRGAVAKQKKALRITPRCNWRNSKGHSVPFTDCLDELRLLRARGASYAAFSEQLLELLSQKSGKQQENSDNTFHVKSLLEQ